MLAKSALPPGAKLTPVNSEVLRRLRANGVTLPSVSNARRCWTPSPSSARKNPPYGDTQMLSGPSGMSEAGCGLTGRYKLQGEGLAVGVVAPHLAVVFGGGAVAPP